MAPVDVPADAEALYEATCFAADSNALEVRELERSGPTTVPEVQRARDAFFEQPVLKGRNLWDRNLFDDDPDTAFAVGRRRVSDMRVRGGAFRLDLGAPTMLDRLVLEVGDDYGLQPLHPQEGVWASVSADLRTWWRVPFFCTENVEGRIPDGEPVRYIRFDGCPDRIRHVRGYYRGRALDRTGWRASNLLATYGSAPATAAWSCAFTLPDHVTGAYLCIALYGEFGHELGYAAVRMGDRVIGAPRRSPSFPYNAWECHIWKPVTGNYTYYIPVTPDMIGQPLEAVALLLRGGVAEALRAEAWVTAYPIPYGSRELVVG
jgi:hypothetical protein